MAQKIGEQQRNVPALQMRASVHSASINEENRTVEMQWSTGEKVLRSSFWDGDFYEELSMDPKHIRMARLTSGRAPFLANHSSRSLSDVIGVIESARVGSATVRFAKDDPAADAAWNKVRQGILPNVSVGYRVHKFEKVEGGDSNIPTFRATDWEPYEVSLVPMGADSQAFIRSEEAAQNPCVFVAPLEERSNMAEEKKDQAPVTAAPVDVEAVRAEGAKLERERVAGINHAVRALGAEGAAFANKLVADGASVEQARAAVLDQLAERSNAQPPAQTPSKVEITEDKADKFQRGVSAWLFERSGSDAVRRAKEKKLKGFENVELDPGEFRGMSLVDIARESLERKNISTRGIYDRERIVTMALSQRATGYATTGDFSVLFENVMYKQMRANYELAAQTWRRFVKTDTVSDFRNANRYQNGSFGTLPVVKEGEEYKNVAIPDGAKVAINVEKRGSIIAISREAIINDDMGALSDLAARFGDGAAESIEEQVYALLALNSGLGPTIPADGNPFFHSSRGNVSSASGAVSVANLSLDKQTMRKQKDISGNRYLNLVPRIALVPIALEDTLRVLNTDAYDPAQTGQKTNTARGMFSDIVSSPRLDVVSATRRYLFTENKEAFVVVFLENSGEGPTLESHEDFRRDGMSWKARMEFKAQAFDPKAAITSAGT